jgi:hypothetical protein
MLNVPSIQRFPYLAARDSKRFADRQQIRVFDAANNGSPLSHAQHIEMAAPQFGKLDFAAEESCVPAVVLALLSRE